MTKVLLNQAGPEREGTSLEIELQDGFETVLSAVIPLAQPSSALEARANFTFTTEEDKRVFIRPEVIAKIEES